MFDSIVFQNRTGVGDLVDVGALAEALLFYRRVLIVGNTGTLRFLLSRLQPFVLLSLLREGRLEFYYLNDRVGVSTTENQTGRGIHRFERFSSPQHTIAAVATKSFKEFAGSRQKAQFEATRFAQLLKEMDHSRFDQRILLSYLTEAQALQRMVSSIVQLTVPTLTTPSVEFKIEVEEEVFTIQTNLDYARLNREYHQSIPSSHSELSDAYILALIQGSYRTLFYASEFQSEVSLNTLDAELQQLGLQSIVETRTKSEQKIVEFSERVLHNAYSIREAVNSGIVPFSKIYPILEKADRFRDWLHKKEPTAELVEEYYRSVTAESWVDRLPIKTGRWMLFTAVGMKLDGLGLGGLGTAAGAAVGAFDALALDRLLKGWRPNQFIEDAVLPVLKK